MVVAGRPWRVSKITTRRKPMRRGSCSMPPSKSQEQPAGQAALGVHGGNASSGSLVGSAVLWKAAATREATSSLGAILTTVMRRSSDHPPSASSDLDENGALTIGMLQHGLLRLGGWPPRVGRLQICLRTSRRRKAPHGSMARYEFFGRPAGDAPLVSPHRCPITPADQRDRLAWWPRWSWSA